MGIDKDGNSCSLCDNGQLETLDHIFLDCSVTADFLSQVSNFIIKHVDLNYEDTARSYLFTLSHPDPCVNFINISLTWFLSRSFQTKVAPKFPVFLRTLNGLLLGEKHIISQRMYSILSSELGLVSAAR